MKSSHFVFEKYKWHASIFEKLYNTNSYVKSYLLSTALAVELELAYSRELEIRTCRSYIVHDIEISAGAD